MILKLFPPVTFCLLMLVACKPDTKVRMPFTEAVSPLYDSSQKPFYHGVASGDPLTDRVVLWTRVTPEWVVEKISVSWEISTDKTFSNIIQQDTISTGPSRDYTVKVDVTNLTPGQFYYYRFKAFDRYSPVGRTKTATTHQTDSLKFAVVSCSNWEFGYFNAYSNIAARELDAVIHLGDYIYEYGTGKYGDTTIGRIHMPSHEAVTLEDYRTRYSQYHLDAGLRAARQQHPFITIWDDHEVANNVYTSGAQNHQEDEGSFSERSAAAKKAYYEWIPIREGKTHYRSFPFGNLAELIMLDERLEGRTKPVDSLSAVDYLDETRTMLGGQQLSWLENELTKSDHTWKLIGNQVIFSDLFNKPPYDSKSRNLDAWDGYPAEKKRLAGFIRESKLKNIVFLTGDTHASWAIEVTDNLNSKNKEIETLAVELGTTSVSSGNGNESESDDAVILKEEALKKANPHVKYLNERDHGYLLISVFQDYIKSEWWYVKTLRKVDTTENLGKVFTIKSGENAFR